jgi:predicted transposase YbfD/YdcC
MRWPWIPSHDTFGDVFAALNPEQFQECLLSWITNLHQITGGQIVAIDGKTLRGSYTDKDKKSAIHMVSAWATENHISLGQTVVAEKSNEITAIPHLLELIEVSGSLVTIDAMGCQTEIAKTIRDKDAHYVLAVKGNQERLFDDINAAFANESATDFSHPDLSFHETEEASHGRHERRRYYVLPVTDQIRDRDRWQDLSAIGMAVSDRINSQGEEELEIRYYILSQLLEAKRFGEAVRSHWGIENHLHWQLDVTFHEDANRVRKDNAPANLSILNRTALSLLKNEKSVKHGIAIKRLRAGWDEQYLEKVIAGASG